MSVCISCGKQNPDNVKFCTHCGMSTSADVVNKVPPPVASPLVPQAPEGDTFQITKKMVKGAIGVVAMVMVAIGSALPWATASASVFSVSKGGLSGDGVITIILSLLGLVFFTMGTFRKAQWPFVLGLILSIVILSIAAYDIANVMSMVVDVSGGAEVGASVTVGVGLVLCLIGGIIGLIAGISGLIRRST